ncbi:hypothetical protein CEY12_20235 [Chryseobacterium sp. T16E-39]|uniref:hypothetical protein n=1 Tax=Chryseobacterium sp. T16E-39 TaxID=2015076 RepID=UPI000B5B1A8B|nr:hypothetical protein [Chryseobacterium sp. T16E-39]ASK32270.1 hypothetical protein CEY12_20235 [Chryseobacterium sp. T16E-39]
MDYNFYQTKFQSVISKVSKKQLERLGLHIAVNEVLESIVIKIYKPEWSGDPQFPLNAVSRIFFSIWVNDKTIGENRIYYNIHAFKLRELKGYKITSRDFADRFRRQFSNGINNWPNAGMEYGPLTLMEGWFELNDESIERDASELIQQFLDISFMIDETLKHYKI